MPYSDYVSPKSRCTLCPAACAPTRAAESAASGAELTSVFHGLSGGRTGQPPTIGPLVTTKGALVKHERPRQARADADDQRPVRAHADGRDADRGGHAGSGDEQREDGGDGEQGGAHPAHAARAP